jgi:threonylcarbamoyladenosine tRNA methylthiotransferase CDKAL1
MKDQHDEMMPCGTKNERARYPAGCRSLYNIQGKKVFIRTFGCTYNHGDTRKLIEVLRHQGCQVLDSPESADAVVVNTCTVIESTTRKVLRTIAAYRDRKLYITGCMPSVEPERILSICNPEFIPPHCIQAAYRLNPTTGNTSPGIVQISQGCTGHCGYCITRFARGPLQSYPVEEITRQVEGYARSGAAEIQLTAQDLSSWGLEKGDSLPSLLKVLATIEGRFRIRLGMMNPHTLKKIMPEIPLIFESGKFFTFIHMPVQSGSDAVLERMGREYSVRDAIDIVSWFRKKIPDTNLMTDMIVGFPGESDSDFQSSLSLLRQIRPNKVNITRYSKRPHTECASAPDFTDYIKKKRSRMMNAQAEELYHAINADWTGKMVPFIVTEKIREGSVIARSPAYLDIVLKEDLPVGTTGHCLLLDEHMYYFTGLRVA